MTVTQVLSPEHVLTHGRILWVPELQPEWTNAGFSLRFRGTGISVHTLPPEVQPDMPAYFDLSVDGRSLLAAPVEMDTELLTVNGLEEGEHLLRVRKRSETRESPVRLSAVTVEGVPGPSAAARPLFAANGVPGRLPHLRIRQRSGEEHADLPHQRGGRHPDRCRPDRRPFRRG